MSFSPFKVIHFACFALLLFKSTQVSARLTKEKKQRDRDLQILGQSIIAGYDIVDKRGGVKLFNVQNNEAIDLAYFPEGIELQVRLDGTWLSLRNAANAVVNIFFRPSKKRRRDAKLEVYLDREMVNSYKVRDDTTFIALDDLTEIRRYNLEVRFYTAFGRQLDISYLTFETTSSAGPIVPPIVPPIGPPIGPPTTLAPTASPTAEETTTAPTTAQATSSTPTEAKTLPNTFPPTPSPTTSRPTTFAPTPSPTTSRPTTFAPTPSSTASKTTSSPTRDPTKLPTTPVPTSTTTTVSPTTSKPTPSPTQSPTVSPTTSSPTSAPTTVEPTSSPTMLPTKLPTTSSPTDEPGVFQGFFLVDTTDPTKQYKVTNNAEFDLGITGTSLTLLVVARSDVRRVRFQFTFAGFLNTFTDRTNPFAIQGRDAAGDYVASFFLDDAGLKSINLKAYTTDTGGDVIEDFTLRFTMIDDGST